MDTYLQRLPYDGLATRTLILDREKVVIRYRNFARSFEDEYEYGKIDPDFRSVRRGETEWSNMVFGLVVASIVLFILTKMSSSLLFNSIILALQLCTAFFAVWLILLIFIRKEHVYILDTSGDCIVSLRATPKAIAFAAKLKVRAEAARGAVPS